MGYIRVSSDDQKTENQKLIILEHANKQKLKVDKGQQTLCDLVKRLSPVAWQHINLIGKYEFYENQFMLNIPELIEAMLSNFKTDFAS